MTDELERVLLKPGARGPIGILVDVLDVLIADPRVRADLLAGLRLAERVSHLPIAVVLDHVNRAMLAHFGPLNAVLTFDGHEVLDYDWERTSVERLLPNAIIPPVFYAFGGHDLAPNTPETGYARLGGLMTPYIRTQLAEDSHAAQPGGCVRAASYINHYVPAMPGSRYTEREPEGLRFFATWTFALIIHNIGEQLAERIITDALVREI